MELQGVGLRGGGVVFEICGVGLCLVLRGFQMTLKL